MPWKRKVNGCSRYERVGSSYWVKDIPRNLEREVIDMISKYEAVNTCKPTEPRPKCQ